MPALTTLIQQSIGSSRHCSRQEREVKVYSLKERKKTISICKWHDCLQRKSQAVSKKNLLEVITIKSEDIKSTHKNQPHFFILTINMLKPKLKTLPFTITPDKIKYLSIQLSKDVQHIINYKMLMK